jgi:hypothetical protein
VIRKQGSVPRFCMVADCDLAAFPGTHHQETAAATSDDAWDLVCHRRSWRP